jgi:DNA-directed RNA polymerase specialized sigma24 family protein
VPLDESPARIAMPVSSVTGTNTHLVLLQLHDEMEVLPPAQRTCLDLKAEGLSYEEIAAHIGGTVDEVRSHIQNGRRTLRIRMAPALASVL